MSENPEEHSRVGESSVWKDHLGQMVKSPIHNAKVFTKATTEGLFLNRAHLDQVDLLAQGSFFFLVQNFINKFTLSGKLPLNIYIGLWRESIFQYIIVLIIQISNNITHLIQ